MINVIGISVSLTYDLDFNKKSYYQSHDCIVEVIESKRVKDTFDKPALELTCKYSLFLEDDPSCKTLQDYTGHVFPFLNSKIGRLIRNENYKFTYIESPLKESNVLHISEIMKKLTL